MGPQLYLRELQRISDALDGHSSKPFTEEVSFFDLREFLDAVKVVTWLAFEAEERSDRAYEQGVEDGQGYDDERPPPRHPYDVAWRGVRA